MFYLQCFFKFNYLTLLVYHFKCVCFLVIHNYTTFWYVCQALFCIIFICVALMIHIKGQLLCVVNSDISWSVYLSVYTYVQGWCGTCATLLQICHFSSKPKNTIKFLQSFNLIHFIYYKPNKTRRYITMTFDIRLVVVLVIHKMWWFLKWYRCCCWWCISP